MRGRSSIEQPLRPPARSIQQVSSESGQRAERIFGAAAERNAARLRSIVCWHRNRSDSQPVNARLNEELLIEDEIVGARFEVDRFQYPPVIGAIARVILGKIQPENDVLEDGEKAIREVLDRWHAARKNLLAAADAGPQDDIDDTGFDEACHERNERPVVLIIGVQHHDHVRVGLEREPVARFLVSAVPTVLGMLMHLDSQLPCDFDSVVRAGVVYEDDVLAGAFWKPPKRRLEGLPRMVGRQHNANGEILDVRKVA